jgi:hypothetical protein
MWHRKAVSVPMPHCASLKHRQINAMNCNLSAINGTALDVVETIPDITLRIALKSLETIVREHIKD